MHGKQPSWTGAGADATISDGEAVRTEVRLLQNTEGSMGNGFDSSERTAGGRRGSS